jgi:predicted RNase H-like nuclease (RuvC/YqgF family)
VANVFFVIVGSAAQQLAHSKMADELANLATKIINTEDKIEKLEHEITNLNKRLDENDFTGTVRYSSQEKVEAALKDLTAKEVALQNEKVALQNEKVALQNEKVELLKKENLLLQQQQQSGAGTSMLPVRLALVIFLLQRSCCMLANLVAFRVCLFACASARTAVACCYWTRLLHCVLENQHAVHIITNSLTCISCCCCVVPGAAQGAGVQAGTLIS